MKITKTGQEARNALKKGIDFAVDAIKTTIGPTGRNAVLGRVDIPPYITNDGVSIARHLDLEDECENQGVWIVKEALSVTSNEAGDATTTTAILIQAIVDEVFDRMKDSGSLIKNNINPVALKKEIDVALLKVQELLNKKSRIIKDSEVYDVALTAGEFPWIADIVFEVFKKIGKDGHVTIQEGVDTSYEISNGIELNVGFHSEYYKNAGEDCVLDNPYVLVTNNIVDTSQEFIELVSDLTKLGSRKLIIIAPDFSPDFLTRVVATQTKEAPDGKPLFTAIPLRLPTYNKDDLLLDVSTLTGARFLDKNIYLRYEDYLADFNIKSLGKCNKSVIGISKSILTGGEGSTKERVKELKKKLKTTSSVFDRDNLEKRIAFLSGGIATINIGAQTDFEKTYFKLKMENAVNSAQNALREGVIKGGGCDLKAVGEEFDSILSKPLAAPYLQIQKLSGNVEIPDTVIDSYKSIITALKSACSVAGTLITTEVLIAIKNDNKNQN